MPYGETEGEGGGRSSKTPPEEGSSDAVDRQERQLKDLSRLSWALVFRDCEALTSMALDILRTGLGADAARILKALDDRVHVRLFASSGHAHLGGSSPDVRTDATSPTGFALQRDEPVLVDDFDTDPELDRLAPFDTDEFSSCIEVRIPGAERPHGVLGAQGRRPAAFSRADQFFVHSVANLVGVALDRQRHQDGESAALEQFRTRAKADRRARSKLSHDLRSPASTLKLSLEVVRRAATGEQGAMSSEEVERAVSKADSNLERLLNLVDELVDIDNPDRTPPELDFP